MEANNAIYGFGDQEELTMLDEPGFDKTTVTKAELQKQTDAIPDKNPHSFLKQIFVIDDTLTNKISYYHILLLLFSLPFDLFYSHIILISFGLHTLINLKKENVRSIFNVRTVILQSAFFITLLGIAYSPNKGAGFTELGRQLAILLIPILFSTTSLDLKKYKDNFLLGFSLCSTLTIAYLYLDALRVIHYYGYSIETLFSAAFTNHNFSDPVGMHATFLALQVGLALVYLLSVLINSTKINAKLFYGACCGLLSIGLLQLSSKSVCVTILIAVCIALPFFILKGKRKRSQFIIVSFAVVLFSTLILSRSQTFRDRFFNDLKDDISQSTNGDITDPRLSRWKVAGELIIKSPVIGYGSGAETDLLSKGYFDKKLYNSFLNKLNAHNEYLSLLLATGILGLLIYLSTLYYGFKNAMASKDVLYLTFILLIVIVSLSENVLDVDKGTMFYGLFFSFFAFTNSGIKELKKQ
ncbi:MAG: O-antigen ligase family protein [Mucilaginibacter sp.]|uniref:O-antigen ligase family protein n=1 Tax=Mucilaginibacter sp. TaxID=1882438 RepID=UPI00326627FE